MGKHIKFRISEKNELMPYIRKICEAWDISVGELLLLACHDYKRNTPKAAAMEMVETLTTLFADDVPQESKIAIINRRQYLYRHQIRDWVCISKEDP
jgi:hypothetical protein